ncbi:hypothetical protein CDD82_5266 [Ophiocordyceps australis]|uniref:Mid2 domain-containing protein n=1 Tax=Ophiocordyceps australis TaxID=1399860 RepID=A0A2C5XIM8_9HYPO|nr:hypothetical protein CDD82_5266 [Ophiocordyceps australis]
MVVVVSALCHHALGHVLPRETTANHSEAISTASRPLTSMPDPTPAPGALLANAQDQAPLNTICGYIGGDAALPATCIAGSHCAVDVKHGAVGCCPDGNECVRGIFTSCVDKNSGPQSLADPYVFTCAGDNVCYKNTFDGGFFQYGCGSASNLATHVATTAEGRPPLQLSHKTLSLTATPTRLSHAINMASNSLSQSLTATVSDPASPSNTQDESAPRANKHSPHTGAILGGTIGGVAFLAFLIALAFIVWRRRRHDARNSLNGRPMSDTQRSFLPMPGSQQALARSGASQGFGPTYRNTHQATSESSGLAVMPSSRQPEAPQRSAVLANNNTIRGVNVEADQVPLTGEMDDASNGYHSALEGVREDDSASQPSSSNAPYPGPRRYGGSALWQQNRRTNRNLKWI